MRFLVADDDPALSVFLARGLETEGHTVRLANDGQGAVETFLNEMPDLTILDLGLPILDGEQVLEQIRLVEGDSPYDEIGLVRFGYGFNHGHLANAGAAGDRPEIE